MIAGNAARVDDVVFRVFPGAGIVRPRLPRGGRRNGWERFFGWGIGRRRPWYCRPSELGIRDFGFARSRAFCISGFLRSGYGFEWRRDCAVRILEQFARSVCGGQNGERAERGFRRPVVLNRSFARWEISAGMFLENLFAIVQSRMTATEIQGVLAIFGRTEALRKFDFHPGEKGSGGVPPLVRVGASGMNRDDPSGTLGAHRSAGGDAFRPSADGEQVRRGIRNRRNLGFGRSRRARPGSRFRKHASGEDRGTGTGTPGGFRNAVPSRRFGRRGVRVRRACRRCGISRVPPTFLIAGRNPVISGHELQVFQTSPLRALLIFVRLLSGMIFRGIRVFFPLRSGRGESRKAVRPFGNIFGSAQRRSLLSVPFDGHVPVLRVRLRF